MENSYREHVPHIIFTQADMNARLYLLDQLLNHMAPLSSLIDPTPKTNDLGTLNVLPNELVISVLEHLSIQDLMRFQRCSRSSRFFVNTIPVIRAALEFVPNVVKGILAIQISLKVTMVQLRQKLQQRHCDHCGHLAQYIYLPTFSRCCFDCGGQDKTREYIMSPASEREIVRRFRFAPEECALLPNFRSLPALFTNGLNKLKWEGRHTFCNYSTTQWKFHNNHGLAVVNRKALGEYFVRCIFHLDDMTSHDTSREDITVVRDRPPDFMMAHMCVVFTPWFSSELSHVDQGLYCTNCLYSPPNLLYTEETFLEHLKDCRVGTTIWD